MEHLLNALLKMAGLDIDQIKALAAQLATDDTVNKVLAFSRELERQNALLAEIRDYLHGSETKPYYNTRYSEPIELAPTGSESMSNGG